MSEPRLHGISVNDLSARNVEVGEPPDTFVGLRFDAIDFAGRDRSVGSQFGERASDGVKRATRRGAGQRYLPPTRLTEGLKADPV
ncbi:hypothetical protein QCD70_06710 [Agreia sp. PsM10]|uniref:hypothetical protein n=1 Tax=Agreia sp. PsM10 TaxID=3030533 RepID=UPI00263A840C|nr:hypothetical protein [Agreia sp. PsM10]MDN4639927.1 hypothetical protein [Agreia sp. PsM10]